MTTMTAPLAVGAAAMLLGFRPAGGASGTLAALGVVALAAFAITWISPALGIIADTVETASKLPVPLSSLPFLSSGFVPTTLETTDGRQCFGASC